MSRDTPIYLLFENKQGSYKKQLIKAFKSGIDASKAYKDLDDMRIKQFDLQTSLYEKCLKCPIFNKEEINTNGIIGSMNTAAKYCDEADLECINSLDHAICLNMHTRPKVIGPEYELKEIGAFDFNEYDPDKIYIIRRTEYWHNINEDIFAVFSDKNIAEAVLKTLIKKNDEIHEKRNKCIHCPIYDGEYDADEDTFIPYLDKHINENGVIDDEYMKKTLSYCAKNKLTTKPIYNDESEKTYFTVNCKYYLDNYMKCANEYNMIEVDLE